VPRYSVWVLRIAVEETLAEVQPQIYDMPAYRAPEAARILALPVGTVNAWCFGHDYRHGDGTPKRFLRVIEPAQPQRRELSFVNCASFICWQSFAATAA